MPTVVPDEIIRSRRKTLAITVDSFARVIVRAPLHCSEARIFAFLEEKQGWISKQKEKMKGAGICLPPENLDGYAFLLLGKTHTVRLTDEKNVRYDGEANIVYVPKANARERLVKWLKENAKRIFSDLTARTAARMGTQYKYARVNSARGRWGSCSGENGIHYSFRLLYAPKDVVEYVVVHELAHTKHKNHSQTFWAEVAAYVPDWKVRRAWLKAHGALMEVF